MISTEFFAYCKAHYSKIGFRRYQQGYSRITNDVLQNFRFKKLSSGRECIVEFGVFPLCMMNLTPEMGAYDSNQKYVITPLLSIDKRFDT